MSVLSDIIDDSLSSDEQTVIQEVEEQLGIIDAIVLSIQSTLYNFIPNPLIDWIREQPEEASDEPLAALFKKI